MKKCARCNKYFEPKYPNSKLCFSCWKARETALEDVVGLRHQIANLESRLHHAEQRLEEFKNFVPTLRQLCHPDRHGNSRASNKAMIWLNGMKQR